MNQYCTITLTKDVVDKLIEYYSPFRMNNSNEYIVFMAKKNTITITVYSSKKADYKVIFSGNDVIEEAKLWDMNARLTEAKEPIKAEWLCLKNQIGSDEVGTGDFLLPIIVCAAFVREKDMKMLKEYGVTDSKKLSDKEILSIGEALAKKFFISKLTLTNEQYNELISSGENLNSIKAKMHNRALLNLLKKFPETKNIFVDQFCSPDLYYSYLNDKNEMQVRNIVFKTKGESYYPSVALASVMARYSFLLEVKKLEAHYKINFPFGASKKVDEFAKEFVAKFGIKELEKIAKTNFANYKDIAK